jgi:hypothetical protein
MSILTPANVSPLSEIHQEHDQTRSDPIRSSISHGEPLPADGVIPFVPKKGKEKP